MYINLSIYKMKPSDYYPEDAKDRLGITNTPDTPTPAITPDARAAKIAQSNPIGGALDIGKHMLEVGDMFGIDKATVGKMLLKGLLTGKFDLPGMKTETARRKKFEVAVDQIIKVAWSFLGIFLVLQTFFFVTTVILVP